MCPAFAGAEVALRSQCSGTVGTVLANETLPAALRILAAAAAAAAADTAYLSRKPQRCSAAGKRDSRLESVAAVSA